MDNVDEGAFSSSPSWSPSASSAPFPCRIRQITTRPPRLVQQVPAAPTVIDPNGDLYLVVGPERHTLQVDSRVLIRACPPWKAMLTQGWWESRPSDGAWLLAWPEDDARAMEILMRILHTNETSRIPAPQTLSVCELFAIAVAVDKYFLLPVVTMWAKAWRDAAVARGVGPDFEELTQLAWIGWVYGEKSLFEEAVNKMAIFVEADREGKLYGHCGTPLEDYEYLMAMGVPELLESERLRTIARLLEILENELPDYHDVISDSTPTETWYCHSIYVAQLPSEDRQHEAQVACHDACLKSLALELVNRELFPIPDPCDVLVTPQEIERSIDGACMGISTLGIWGCDVEGEQQHLGVHAMCGPGPRLERQVEDVMMDVKCEFGDDQVKYLERQAKIIAGL